MMIICNDPSDVHKSASEGFPLVLSSCPVFMQNRNVYLLILGLERYKASVCPRSFSDVGNKKNTCCDISGKDMNKRLSMALAQLAKNLYSYSGILTANRSGVELWFMMQYEV